MKNIIIIFLILSMASLSADESYRTVQRSTIVSADNGTKHKVGDFGNYHALLIYVEDYIHLRDLKTPKKDVEAVAKILRDRYGFKTEIVRNPRHSDELIGVLDEFKNRLGEDDNLLIYYAGHGSKNGRWQLKNAKENSRVGSISIKEAVDETIKEMRSKHILVVADSCYSGNLIRGPFSVGSLSPSDKKYYSKVYNKKSRTALTSGGFQPVLDGDPSSTGLSHSIFANGFLNMLRENSRPIFALEEQSPLVKRYVFLGAEQDSLYSPIRRTGHENGGDFIFLDRQNISNSAGEEETLPTTYALTISTTPSNAKVEILNIQLVYKDGIMLAKGVYEIRVSANGYDERRFNIELEKEAIYNIVLNEKELRLSYEPQMIPISRGSYTMGSNKYKDEKPPHKVNIDYDFEIGKYEVSVGEFRSFVNDTGYKTEAEKGDGCYVYDDSWKKKSDANWKNPYFEQSEAHPVVCVSWNDSKAYIEWLNGKTQKNYGLLSEAEWEFVARAGTITKWKWSFGDSKSHLKNYAWYDENSYDLGKSHKDYGTHQVGTKKPNPWGVHDMHGNVWEWCEDDWAENYNSTPIDGSANQSQKDKYKVLRGGSWYDFAFVTRSAYRYRNTPSIRYYLVGFRLQRTLP